jgi:hypothetical protein
MSLLSPSRAMSSAQAGADTVIFPMTVDAEKAFDTVNHDIMLNKLYHDGITGDMWLLLRNIYDGLIL